MKKLRSLTVFLAAILLLIGCEKEKPPVDKEFTPDHWPIVKTLEATLLTSSTAKLTGTVNAYGLSTTVTFEYGTTTSYGSSVTANQSPVTGYAITNVSADISGLILDTTYHFRVKAENSLWKNFYGRDMVFTIHSPKVETLAVTNATSTSITLNGTVNTYGLSTPITFEYGTTTSYGSNITADQSPLTGNSITNVSADISGLTTCNIYHYRVKAENSCGIVYGSDKTFISGIPTWTTYTTADGLADNHVNTIAIDAQGNKWFGTEGGVSKFDGTTWTTYTTADGLIGNYVYAIAIDDQSNEWFGCQERYDTEQNKWVGGGVSKFDGIANWTNYTITNSGLAGNFINAIAIDGSNNIWISCCYIGGYMFPGWEDGVGVSKFDGTNWTTYPEGNSGLVNNYVYAIAIDAQGNKWFGTRGGVSKFDGTTWTTYLANGVLAIAIDAQGNNWFGTWEGGVSKFDGTNWTTYTIEDGLVCTGVIAIAIDAQGNKWFGTEGGVSKFDGTTWTSYLLGNNVHAIAIDADGNKWFGTDGGVSKLSEGCN